MASDYEQLIKALRLCQFGECGCGKCYYKELKGDWCTEDNHPEFFDCDDKLKLDAAAAIEALQAETVRLWPKRGKWINSKERMRPDMCSVCGCVYEADRFMDKIAWNYCPNCGANMEVQDGSSR